MEITYIGHSCFKIKGKELTLVIDPYDPAQLGIKLPKLEADVVLVSHDHFDHNYVKGVNGYSLLISGQGEYEKQGMFVYGIETFHDDKEGKERGGNVMYAIELDGFTILHTGDLGHELSTETLEKIPNIDVLMVPVGGVYTIDAEKAVKVISDTEPGIVIPMHYSEKGSKNADLLAPLDKFLDEMGVEGNGKTKTMEKLKISSRNDIPSETEVIVLEPQH